MSRESWPTKKKEEKKRKKNLIYKIDSLQENDHLPAEPAAPEILDAAGGPGADPNGGDDGQWNPMEWDRAAEELTWERLLGLDGSLVFLEHVFWVVSLNTLFILVFGELEDQFCGTIEALNPGDPPPPKNRKLFIEIICRAHKSKMPSLSIVCGATFTL
jgi:hypothetical protein